MGVVLLCARWICLVAPLVGRLQFVDAGGVGFLEVFPRAGIPTSSSPPRIVDLVALNLHVRFPRPKRSVAQSRVLRQGAVAVC